MKYAWSILFSTLSIFCTAQELSKKELAYKPVNLEEAVEQLMKIYPDSIRQQFMGLTEDEFVALSHMDLGMWMRNNWGLWKGKDLAKYFNSIGIAHPDDMSSIILRCFYRELKEEDWRVAEQVQYFKDYWKKGKE